MSRRRPEPKRYDLGWRVNFDHPPGTRHRVKFSARRYPDARKAAEEYIDAVLGGRSYDDQPIRKVARIYLSWAERTGHKRLSTIKSDTGRLSTFCDWAEETGIGGIRDITLDHIRKFETYFLDNYPLYRNRRRRLPADLDPDELIRRRSKTWAQYYFVISALLNWAAERDYVERNILKDTKEFRVKQQQRIGFRIFDQAEITALLEYFDNLGDPVTSVFFRLLAHAGLRVGEVMNLRWGAVDLNNEVIQIAWFTKSRRVRAVPIAPSLLARLWELRKRTPNDSALVVAGDAPGRRRYSHDGWYKLLQRALKSLDLDHARLHDFRHTFGASLAQQNVPIGTIKELMGHARIETTMIYVHFAPKHLDSAISKLPY